MSSPIIGPPILSAATTAPSGHPLLEKWKACGFPTEAFAPDLAKLIFDAHMHNSIRYFGHNILFNKEMQIMIDGRYQSAKEVLSNLRVEGESIVSKTDPEEKWCYIDTGLCRWDQSGWKTLKPIAKLTREELDCVQAKAQMLVSPKAKETPEAPTTFTIEIVSSWTATSNDPLLSGVEETFQKPRHPWIRLITAEGDVYDVGFGWEKASRPENVGAYVRGAFRSPDPWETMAFQARPVTRIAINEKQFQAIKADVENRQKEGIAFHLVQHNCTRFIKYILEDFAGFTNVPVHASVSEVIFRILPVKMQNIFTKIHQKLAPVFHEIKKVVNAIQLPFLDKVVNAIKSLPHVILFAFGAGKGKQNLQTFNEKPQKPEPESAPRSCFAKKRVVWINSISDFFNNHLVLPILPRKLIEWQMAQPSTVVYSSKEGFHGQYKSMQT